MTLIQLILGSTRQDRFSARAGAWAFDRLSARGDMEVELIDLRDYPLPFFDGRAPAHTLRDYPTPEVARFGQTIDRADGFVFVTPEYNHGYPAVLMHLLPDVLVPAIRAPEPFDPTLLDPAAPRLMTLGDDLLWWAEALAGARAAS